MAHPHDTGYKALFMLPELVQQLIEEFAPAAIGELLDFATLQRHPGNFITPLFTEKIEDVVWSLKLKSAAPVRVYLYILLEFQSKPERTMAPRMLHC